jgi:hypothetical protein
MIIDRADVDCENSDIIREQMTLFTSRDVRKGYLVMCVKVTAVFLLMCVKACRFPIDVRKGHDFYDVRKGCNVQILHNFYLL